MTSRWRWPSPPRHGQRAVHGPRPVQGRQRQLRPRHRRPGAARAGPAPAGGGRVGGTVGRFGGDEYVVVADRRRARGRHRPGRALTDVASEPFTVTGPSTSRSRCSCRAPSASPWPAPPTTPPSLLHHADAAMYRAKARARDRGRSTTTGCARRRAPPHPRIRPHPGPRRGGLRAALPADRRPGHQPDQRRSRPSPAGRTRSGAGAPDGVHPRPRGDRRHPPARALGARRRLPPAAQLARTVGADRQPLAEPLAPAAEPRRPGRRHRRRHPGVRDRARPADLRDHRDVADARPQPRREGAVAAPRHRVPPGARRLRHRAGRRSPTFGPCPSTR